MKHLNSISTQLLHFDRLSKLQHAPNHQPIYKSVQFDYQNAEDIVDVFQGRSNGFTYSRSGNPTVNQLEQKLSLLEDGVGAVSFATGMGAIVSMMISLLKAGDHVIASQYLFGNTSSLFSTLERHGIVFDYVDATEVDNVSQCLRATTKMVFVETLANPRTQIADLEGIGQLCKAKQVLFVVDNTMGTPLLVQPKRFGADLVMHSLSKSISGSGNVLGGVIIDTGLFDWASFDNILPIYQTGPSNKWGLVQLRKKGLRDLGATLSADSAQMISVGLETLELRGEKTNQNALALAKFLNEHPKVAAVDYPGLVGHPQHHRAVRYFAVDGGVVGEGKTNESKVLGFGALISFTLKPDVDLFSTLNRLKIVMKSTGLGDNRTMTLPVAQTIYCEMDEARKLAWGISNGLIRLSVGIESVADLISDWQQALA